MNIPDIVKIGYKEFQVKKIEDDVVNDNKVCYGDIDHNSCVIRISTLYSEDLQKCTFIHECLHGIDEIMECELSEDQVRNMAKGVYSLIKDNQKIFNSI